MLNAARAQGMPMMVIAMMSAAMSQPMAISRPPNTIHSRLSKMDNGDMDPSADDTRGEQYGGRLPALPDDVMLYSLPPRAKRVAGRAGVGGSFVLNKAAPPLTPPRALQVRAGEGRHDRRQVDRWPARHACAARVIGGSVVMGLIDQCITGEPRKDKQWRTPRNRSTTSPIWRIWRCSRPNSMKARASSSTSWA